jgi:prepilin-type N-terminal cleavage/methylation domain-containing protein/prepilin-type processing-associated H-X9-DG protein
MSFLREASVINDVPTRFRASLRGPSQPNRRGFTLVELLVVIGVIVLLISILLPAARRSIEAGRQAVCMNHLRQIAQGALLYCQENDGAFPAVCGVDPPMPNEWIYAEALYAAPFNDVSQSPVLRYLSQRDSAILRCPSDDIASHPNPNINHPNFGPYNFSYVMNGWTAQWPQGPSPWPIWPRNAYKAKYGMWPASYLREVKDPSQKIFFLEGDPRFLDDGTYLIKIFLTADDPTGSPFAEPPSFVHDVYRDMADPAKSSSGWASRTNAVFCDGHGEFVRGDFIVPGIAHPTVNDPKDRVHFDPHL